MMTLHYHGGPITPYSVLYTLAGKCFCVSHAKPDQVAVMHQIGQSVMLDNGAFSKHTKGKPTDWRLAMARIVATPVKMEASTILTKRPWRSRSDRPA